ncbi:MAG TPA: SusE domain-containing protein [Flavisolibacter sp.]
MKALLKITLLVAVIAVLFTACKKVDELPFYGDGTAPTLTASATTVAPAAADSNNIVLRLNWTNPKYATDTTNYKFTVQIDSAGKNFSRPDTKVVLGTSGATFTAKELNNFLVARGYAFNAPVDMDVRVISSYANNNERLTSNVVRIKMTPYKIPPKIALPASGRLFIVGSATQGGWANPVPVPSQELARLDETTWSGIFQLNADQSYLLLPVNTNVWDVKFGGAGGNNSNNVNGDNFLQGGSDLKAPATSGWYKLIFDFQTGKFTVTPYTTPLPTNLFLVGNATPGGDASGWNNPVPVPSQQFTRINSSVFELTIPLNAGKSYVFLPVNGSWTDKYGGMGGNNTNNANGDEFKFGGSDMLSPATSGTYKISVNFAAGTASGSAGRFTLTKQ